VLLLIGPVIRDTCKYPERPIACIILYNCISLIIIMCVYAVYKFNQSIINQAYKRSNEMLQLQHAHCIVMPNYNCNNYSEKTTLLKTSILSLITNRHFINGICQSMLFLVGLQLIVGHVLISLYTARWCDVLRVGRLPWRSKPIVMNRWCPACQIYVRSPFENWKEPFLPEC